MAKYILALDQGTTSSRALLFDRNHKIAGLSQFEFPQIYPKEGWVEHDPIEIYNSQHNAMADLLKRYGISPADIGAIGITNQRETTILWDRYTGEPVYNAIVWQCRRTAPICEELIERGLSDYIKSTTGLLIDAYFSASKIKWILDNVEGVRERAVRGDILFGTVDTWLIWKLTGGKVHVTDYTNASRTMLFDIRELRWDRTILNELDIPESILPEVRESSCVYGYADVPCLAGTKIPIAGAAGDQQAALFGQGCFNAGDLKNTYGTGCFLLMNTGNEPVESRNGLVTSISFAFNGKVQYALEGSVFVGGAVIQWLRDEMRFFSDSRDAEYLAQKVEDTGGVYLVPAFTGLGAPHWDMYARGCIVGLTRGTKREHIIRAAQESIAYQSYDLVQAMERDIGRSIGNIRADGGASRDRFLMQFQADIFNREIYIPANRETTALGAAGLAGLAAGFWSDTGQFLEQRGDDTLFKPSMDRDRRSVLISGWNKAVKRSLGWADGAAEL